MNTKTTPKDFFLHLGATVALYVSVITISNLAFALINRILSDTLTGYPDVGSIAWPVSTLIVLVPILIVLERLIRKEIAGVPEKRMIGIRRSRLYLTIFLTGATMAVDLITLINTYLNGEITTRFICKFGFILIISIIVFTFYICELSGEVDKFRSSQKFLAWAGIVMVLITIIGGFVVVGSPAKQRALRLDRMRVNSLSGIQYSAGHYWQEFGKVPDTLSDLTEYMGYSPKDPSTNAPYVYEKTVSSSNAFKICAVFEASSTEMEESYAKPIVSGGDFSDWRHGPGLTCFQRTVNPVDFPPAKKVL